MVIQMCLEKKDLEDTWRNSRKYLETKCQQKQKWLKLGSPYFRFLTCIVLSIADERKDTVIIS